MSFPCSWYCQRSPWVGIHMVLALATGAMTAERGTQSQCDHDHAYPPRPVVLATARPERIRASGAGAGPGLDIRGRRAPSRRAALQPASGVVDGPSEPDLDEHPSHRTPEPASEGELPVESKARLPAARPEGGLAKLFLSLCREGSEKPRVHGRTFEEYGPRPRESGRGRARSRARMLLGPAQREPGDERPTLCAGSGRRSCRRGSAGAEAHEFALHRIDRWHRHLLLARSSFAEARLVETPNTLSHRRVRIQEHRERIGPVTEMTTSTAPGGRR